MKKLLLILLLPMIGFGQNDKLDFQKGFEIGAIMGFTSNKIRGTIKENWENTNFYLEAHNRFIGGTSIQYNMSPSFSINSKALYHIKGNTGSMHYIFTNNNGNVIGQYYPTLTSDYHYISLPLSIQFNYGTDFQGFVNSGFYLSYLLKAVQMDEYSAQTLTGGLYIPDTTYISEIDIDGYNRLDFGFILGGGVSYPIHHKLRIYIEGSMHLGLIDLNKNSDYSFHENLSYQYLSYNILLGCSYNLNKTID